MDAVRAETRRLLDIALVKSELGEDADVSRVDEARAMVLIRQRKSSAREEAILGKIEAILKDERINWPHDELTNYSDFSEIVGGQGEAVDALSIGEEVDGRLVCRNLLTKAEMRRQLNSMQWRHYVYGLCRPDGSVFYVGKGTARRALDHEKEAAAGGVSSKCATIRELGDDLRYALFLSCADDAFAAGYEARMLMAYAASMENISGGSRKVMQKMFSPPPGDASHIASSIRWIKRHIEEAYAENARLMACIVGRSPWVMSAIPEEDRDWYLRYWFNE